MTTNKKKFYVVWMGKVPGIYEDWEDCKKQVENFPGASFKSFPNLAEAREALEKGYQQPFEPKEKKEFTKTIPKKAKKPILESWSVDAACSGNPGKVEYQGVDTRTKEKIFAQGPFENGTNNIGEFLAIVHALALLKQRKSNIPIYSDSKTAISWVRNKMPKTQLQQDEKNKKLFELLERAMKWLQNNDYQNKILKWDTENWGEIPADYNRKK